MSKTTELVERLRELPRDTRKATVEIYDLCIEASYEIEGADGPVCPVRRGDRGAAGAGGSPTRRREWRKCDGTTDGT